MTTTGPTLVDLAGTELGTTTVSYRDADAILYALTVGADAGMLDLVYERDLRVLPTYACALGLWAVEKAGRLGAYDPHRSLHASQALVMKHPLPPSGEIEMTGRVERVLEKGKAAMLDVVVDADYFTATYGIFLPGMGGFGGAQSASGAAPTEPAAPEYESSYATDPQLAAMYRLTGDRHPIHIDPAVAVDNGFDRPILHGLCTLGIAARMVAEQLGRHPAELQSLSARLSAPVLPGETLTVRSGGSNDDVAFTTMVGDRTVLKAGRATFPV